MIEQTHAAIIPKPLTTDLDLVFIDLETTGTDPNKHEIIEIAASRYSPQLILRKEYDIPEIHLRVFPEHIKTADPIALEINRYDQTLWDRTGTHLRIAVNTLRNLCNGNGGVVLLAWNVSFDWSFLERALALYSSTDPLQADYHRICVASMCWPLAVGSFVEKIKLETVCERLGISNEGAHGAMRDVERMVEVYKRLVPPRRIAT